MAVRRTKRRTAAAPENASGCGANDGNDKEPNPCFIDEPRYGRPGGKSTKQERAPGSPGGP